MSSETIVAIATASGKGGIGIIRVSGPLCESISMSVLGKVPKPRYADYLKFKDLQGNIVDEGIAILFKSPASFTGEDVLELQCHGGPVVLDILLNEILKISNVRQAQPGEFTQRAFLNNKIDLTQAEAVGDLINASSESAAKNAIKSLQGDFSKLINKYNTDIINLRMFIEATIDFPEEDVDFIANAKITQKLNTLITELNEVLKKAQSGVAMQEGLKIVIAGIPNSGKSSLLNTLCEKDCAIVTDIEGTTRDVVKEYINIDGLPIHIIDTAGLRQHTSDIVEKIGITKAWNEILQADRIMFVFDATQDYQKQIDLLDKVINETSNKIPFSIICNKSDILSNFDVPEIMQKFPVIKISTKNNNGIQDLKNHLKSCAGLDNTTEGIFSARRRHIKALENSLNHLNSANDLLSQNIDIEFCAEELRSAHEELNIIVGKYTSDDLLSEIFSSFCIGK